MWDSVFPPVGEWLIIFSTMLLLCRKSVRSRLKEGYYTAVIFVVQMDGVKCFRPNEINDPDFASALRKAEKSGVHLFALSCKVTPDSVNINGKIPIEL